MDDPRRLFAVPPHLVSQYASKGGMGLWSRQGFCLLGKSDAIPAILVMKPGQVGGPPGLTQLNEAQPEWFDEITGALPLASSGGDKARATFWPAQAAWQLQPRKRPPKRPRAAAAEASEEVAKASR